LGLGPWLCLLLARMQGLASERSRWSEDVSKLQEQSSRLVGDGLLFASFLSYLGPFTFDYRQSMLQNLWLPDVVARKLPLTQPFSVEELMTTDATIQCVPPCRCCCRLVLGAFFLLRSLLRIRPCRVVPVTAQPQSPSRLL
jgi:hypothetical protein